MIHQRFLFLFLLLLPLLTSCIGKGLSLSGVTISQGGSSSDDDSSEDNSFESLLDFNIPISIGGPAVSSASYGCGVTKTKNVLCWGHNNLGQLGDSTYDNSLDPVTVVGGEQGGTDLENIISVSSGHSHTCALDEDGAVYCWGANNTAAGTLGSNDTTSASSPTPVRVLRGEQASSSIYLEDIKFIGTGYSFTCALTNQNTVYCWGAGNLGKMGNGATTSQPVPVQVVAGEQIGDTHLINVRQLSVGFREACAVTTADELYCWGDRNAMGTIVDSHSSSPRRTNAGQQGGHTYLQDVKMVAANWNEVCALMNDESVYCWGQSNTGNLGHDPASGANHRLPLRVLAGEQTTGSSGGYLGNIKSLTAGIRNRCAITNDNEVLCWGGSYTETTPVYVMAGDQGEGRLKNIHNLNYSSVNICAFDSDEKPYCWMGNGQGQLGLGYTSAVYTVPQLLNF